jgi:uncharacterized protein (UPF0335 family)
MPSPAKSPRNADFFRNRHAMTEQPRISMSRPDGTMTPPVTMDVMKQALDQVRGALPMKDDTDFRKHNQDAYAVTADELRQFVERAEQLASEKRDIAEQEKELFAEAKGRGYDTKVMRKIIALRKRKPDEVAEEQAVLDIYKAALGMG